jgi:hypothetical protein
MAPSTAIPPKETCMPERKGAEIIVDHLVAQGVPWLFGLCR